MTQVAKLTIDNTKVAGDLTDFPVYVNLADMPASFWNTVANGGGDIRVFKADGTTELPREVVSCDTSTETGELHFKYTGTLSGSTDTEVQIHADGTSADYAVTATYGRNNVWNNYNGVYHGNETSGTTATSSTGSNNGTVSNARVFTTELAGKLAGTCFDFDENDNMVIPLKPVLNNFTITGWIKFNNTGTDVMPFDNGWFTASQNLFLYRFSSNILSVGVRNGGTANEANTGSFTVTSGVWYRYAMRADGTNLTLRIDSTQRATVSSNISSTSANDLVFAKRQSANDLYLDGAHDEVRIKLGVLSNDWLDTEYNNQNSPSTFYTAESPIIMVNITDTMSLLDVTTGIRSRVVNVTDTLGMTDTISAIRAYVVNLVDTMNLSETLTGLRTMALSITDSLGLTDSVNAKKRWDNQTKGTSTFSNQSKGTSTFSNQTKDSSSWTNQNKEL